MKNSGGRKEKAVAGGTQNSDDSWVDDFLDFSNDGFLDFSNDDVVVEDEDEDEDEFQVQGASVSSNDESALHRNTKLSSAGEDFESLPTSELAVPMDELSQLEWSILEDSSTPYSAPAKKPAWLTGDRRHPVAPVNEESCFKNPLPAKIRTKRTRTGASAWYVGSPSLTDSSTSSTTSSSSSSGLSSPLWPSRAEFLDETVVKRQKKKKKKKMKKKMKKKNKPSSSLEVSEDGGQTQTQTRRCSHCDTQKTPQWRAGPRGAKTLCNACGVRYKAGRLLPEYRPASSPTFSSELHSNHHRKVVEIRRKKAEASDDADEFGWNMPV